MMAPFAIQVRPDPSDLLEWLHPLAGLEGLILMLEAYFDESATQNPNDAFVVAGYVATGEQWKRFGFLWTKTLEKYEIDPAVFHMTDFESKEPDGTRRRPFHKLTDTRAIAMLRRLLRLITRFTVVGVSEGLALEDYQEHIAMFLHTEAEDFADPYVPCLLACLKRIEMYQARGIVPAGQIACTFHHGYNPGRLSRVYESFAEKYFPGLFLKSHAFGAADEVVPLQAADVLAFESLKHIKNRILGPTFRPPRRTLEILAKDVNLRGGYYQPELLQEIARDTRAHMEKLQEWQQRNKRDKDPT